MYIDDLEDAIKAKDIEAVQSAINSGFDLNMPIEDNYRLVMLAASCGKIEIVKLLVEAGANLDAYDNGETALTYAAGNCHREIYDYLYSVASDEIRRHANKYARNKMHYALIKREREANQKAETFIKAALFGDLARVQSAIKRKKVDINAIGSDGKTALMYAAREHRVAIVKALLEAGANPDLINDRENDGKGEGFSALMYVVDNRWQHDDYAVLLKLLKKARANLNLQQSEGYTALMLAAKNGYLLAVRELLNIGVDIDIRDNNGNTALMLARRCFQPDSTYDHINHWLKSYKAMKPRYSEVIQLLKDRNASQVGIENIELIFAAETNNVDRVKSLISAGVNVNHECNGTPLCGAAYVGNVETVRLLIEAGADIDKKVNDSYFNPLLSASYAGHSEVVKLLVEAGANIHTRVKDYLNAVEYAELGFQETNNDDFDRGIKYLEIIEFLEQAGAKFDYE